MKKLIFIFLITGCDPAYALNPMTDGPFSGVTFGPGNPYGSEQSVSYLLRDEFSTDLAAGSVHGTLSTSGHTRCVTDTENKLSIASGALTVAGGKASSAWGDPRISYIYSGSCASPTSFGRLKGRMLLYGLTNPNTATFINLAHGYDSDLAGSSPSSTDSFLLGGIGGYLSTGYYSNIYVDTSLPTGTNYFAILDTNPGGQYFAKMSGSSVWKLLFTSTAEDGTTHYPTFTNYSGVFSSGFMRMPLQTHLFGPTSSDGFSNTPSPAHVDVSALINKSYDNTVVVSTTIAAALASISDASVSNTYKISIPNGTYNEENLTMKDYVDLVGESRAGVIIQSSSQDYDTITGGGKTFMLANLTVTHTTGDGEVDKYPIHFDAGGENAVFITYNITSQTIGARGKSGIGIGTRAGQNIYLINSTFIGSNNVGIYAHNFVSQSSPANIYVINSTATGSTYGLRYDNIGSGQTDKLNLLSGSSFSGTTGSIYIINNNSYPAANSETNTYIDKTVTYNTLSAVGIVAYSPVSSDGLGHAETSGIGAGGSGVAWNWPNTWNVSSEKAVNSPILNYDIIVNGTFTTDANWTKGTDWLIDDSDSNVAAKTAGTGADLTAAVAPLTSGTWYQLTYDVTRTAGTITPKFGTQTGIARSADGTYTEIIRANGTGLAFTADAAFAGTIDNVIVQSIALSTMFATVQDTVDDVLVKGTFTTAAGFPAGIIINLDSTSNPQNYVLFYANGTGCYIDEVVNGTATNRGNSTSSPCNAALSSVVLSVISDGTSTLFYANSTKVAGTLGAAKTQTIHGIFSSGSVTNTVDNLTIRPRGNNGEYSFLNVFIN